MTATYEIEAGPDRVRAWSDFRLPFRPKGEALRFREELRGELLRLRRGPALHATYAAGGRAHCDVENVLLYNVGSGAFRGVGTASVDVERSRGPVLASPCGARRPHLVEYRVKSCPGDLRSWRRGTPLIAWMGVELARPLDVSSIWAAFRNGRATTATAWDGVTPLGIDITIESEAPVGLIGNVKVLIDGIVSAAHVHDGTDLATVSTRLGAKLGVGPDEAAAWLMGETGAALGRRRVLARRARGVQWNPGDDHFVAIRLRSASGCARGTRVTALIYVVEPADPARA